MVEEALEAVLSAADLPDALARVGEILTRCMGETRVAIHRRSGDASSDRLRPLLICDPRHPSPPEPGASLPLAGTAAGRALADGRPCVVAPIDAMRPRYQEEALLGQLGWGSLVSFPLVHGERLLGTLDVAHPSRAGLPDCCFQMARAVARLVALALRDDSLVEEVQRLNRLLDRERACPGDATGNGDGGPCYVVESAPMRLAVERVRLVAPSTTTVLVRGETGTGKEGVARLVHEWSPRSRAPLVVANMGAIPESLIESELFGHEKGAFTGAARRRVGRFEQAEGGTIFLDEVGDAPPSVQVRMLRVLQEREIQRVGGTETLRIDVRVVAATNRNLEEMVKAGTFREDLYYRLAIFPIELPPLRERPEEIRSLALHLLQRHAALMNRKSPQLSEQACRILEAYPWPGNVRELENFLQRALILSPGPNLELPELPSRAEAHEPAGEPRPAMPGRWDEEVRGLIRRALRITGGKIYGPDGAATLLGLPPTTLQGKMRKYGIAVDEQGD